MLTTQDPWLFSSIRDASGPYRKPFEVRWEASKAANAARRADLPGKDALAKELWTPLFVPTPTLDGLLVRESS
jgi:hypothetical protein